MDNEYIIPQDLRSTLLTKELPVSKDGVLMLWEQSKKALEAAKAFEMDLRKVAVKLLVEKPKEGMNTVELGNGYQAKAGIKYNYNLADNDTVENCLNEIAKIGNEGAFIADRLVSWKPSFLLTEYRQLCKEKEKGNETAAQILKVVEKMVIITDASPTLEIKEPKGKKK